MLVPFAAITSVLLTLWLSEHWFKRLRSRIAISLVAAFVNAICWTAFIFLVDRDTFGFKIGVDLELLIWLDLFALISFIAASVTTFLARRSFQP